MARVGTGPSANPLRAINDICARPSGPGKVSILAATPVPAVMIEFSRPTRNRALRTGMIMSVYFRMDW
jgi:hypothetical protein